MADQRAGLERKADRRIARRMWWWEWGEIIVVYGVMSALVISFGVVFWIGAHR